MSNTDHKQTIIDGMAAGLFADNWAQLMEEQKQPLGRCEVTEVMPEVDPSAIRQAEELYDYLNERVELEKDETLKEIYQGIERDAEHDEYWVFGWYAALQSLGHGVGLFDFDLLPERFSDTVPHVDYYYTSFDFGYYGVPSIKIDFSERGAARVELQVDFEEPAEVDICRSCVERCETEEGDDIEIFEFISVSDDSVIECDICRDTLLTYEEWSAQNA